MSSHSTFTPLARSERLVIQPVDDELLVYDLEADRAHCLNATSAFIWQSCDGARTVVEIADMTAKRFGGADAAGAVEYALGLMAERRLLVDSPVPFDKPKASSRREMIRKLGTGAAIAIPVISSVLAPTHAYASASCSCLSNASCLGGRPDCPPGATVCNPVGTCVPANITVTVPAANPTPR